MMLDLLFFLQLARNFFHLMYFAGHGAFPGTGHNLPATLPLLGEHYLSFPIYCNDSLDLLPFLLLGKWGIQRFFESQFFFFLFFSKGFFHNIPLANFCFVFYTKNPVLMCVVYSMKKKLKEKLKNNQTFAYNFF